MRADKQALANVRVIAEWMPGWTAISVFGDGTEAEVRVIEEWRVSTRTIEYDLLNSRDDIALVEDRLRAEGHGPRLLWMLQVVCARERPPVARPFATAALRTAACAAVIREPGEAA